MPRILSIFLLISILLVINFQFISANEELSEETIFTIKEEMVEKQKDIESLYYHAAFPESEIKISEWRTLEDDEVLYYSILENYTIGQTRQYYENGSYYSINDDDETLQKADIEEVDFLNTISFVKIIDYYTYDPNTSMTIKTGEDIIDRPTREITFSAGQGRTIIWLDEEYYIPLRIEVGEERVMSMIELDVNEGVDSQAFELDVDLSDAESVEAEELIDEVSINTIFPKRERIIETGDRDGSKSLAVLEAIDGKTLNLALNHFGPSRVKVDELEPFIEIKFDYPNIEVVSTNIRQLQNYDDIDIKGTYFISDGNLFMDMSHENNRFTMTLTNLSQGEIEGILASGDVSDRMVSNMNDDVLMNISEAFLNNVTVFFIE